MEDGLRKIRLTYSVKGYVEHEIKLFKDCTLSNEELLAKLNLGEILYEESDGVVRLLEDNKTLGFITDSDNNVEHDDFRVEDIED